MSELQTPESLDRILGSSDGSVTDALVDLVRRRPLSVLLLDEFEKANGRVWDVFLQVFDDARLTDRRGATVDFRHTVIILTSNLDSGTWRDRKASTMALMGDPHFWQRGERFEILAQAEYIDRIDSAARRLRSLLDRLHGDGRARRQGPPASLLSTAALNLYLLETACADVEQGRPIEAFVQVEPEPGTARKGAPAAEFAAEIGGMYAAWIRKRRMHGHVLEEERSAAGYRLVLAVAGFGAYSILENEDGLHTLERPGEGGRAERISCRVRVVPQDPLSPDRSPQALKTAAARQLAARPPERARIVRRYRRSPSPLVRDAVRGWKTGRLDLVLGGDFDLMAES